MTDEVLGMSEATELVKKRRQHWDNLFKDPVQTQEPPPKLRVDLGLRDAAIVEIGERFKVPSSDAPARVSEKGGSAVVLSLPTMKNRAVKSSAGS